MAYGFHEIRNQGLKFQEISLKFQSVEIADGGSKAPCETVRNQSETVILWGGARHSGGYSLVEGACFFRKNPHPSCPSLLLLRLLRSSTSTGCGLRRRRRSWAPCPDRRRKSTTVTRHVRSDVRWASACWCDAPRQTPDAPSAPSTSTSAATPQGKSPCRAPEHALDGCRCAVGNVRRAVGSRPLQPCARGSGQCTTVLTVWRSAHGCCYLRMSCQHIVCSQPAESRSSMGLDHHEAPDRRCPSGCETSLYVGRFHWSAGRLALRIS